MNKSAPKSTHRGNPNKVLRSERELSRLRRKNESLRQKVRALGGVV